MLGFFNEKDNGKRNSPDSGSDSNSISDIIESAGRSGGKRFEKILEKVFHAYLQNKNSQSQSSMDVRMWKLRTLQSRFTSLRTFMIQILVVIRLAKLFVYSPTHLKKLKNIFYLNCTQLFILTQQVAPDWWIPKRLFYLFETRTPLDKWCKY